MQMVNTMNEQNEIMEDMNQEEFAKMLEASLNAKDNFESGDKVKGIIVNFSSEYAFIDISGKSEAIINISEFYDANGNITAKKGDTIEAYVVSIKRGEVLLTSKIGRGPASGEIIRMAYSSGIPVEGRVTEKAKGGYIVLISETRCFCPFSQIDINAAESEEFYIGKNFLFKITEYSERGRNIVLSRRVILEAQKKEKQEELKQKLKPGDLVKGTIASIQKFGLFVDLDGIQALVPRSELSWERNADPNAFKKGDMVHASIIDMDWDNNRLTLSIKKQLPDPWSAIDLTVGQRVTGKISNIIKNGAFMELLPGIEGFIHISRMDSTKRIGKPEEVVSVGQSVNAKISGIDKVQHKISLDLISEEEEQWNAESIAQQSSGDTGGSTLGDMLKDKFAELQKKIDK